MPSFISAKEAAERWNISQRRVAILCAEKRVDGAMFVGKQWIIPNDAEKPLDLRTVRYEKRGGVELKPFVKWAGGKGQLIYRLEKFIPRDGGKICKKYAEPFIGGGALLFDVLSKFNFEQVYISDTNAELINAYKVIKSDVESLIDELAEMQTDYLPLDDGGRKNYYYAARERFNGTCLNGRTSPEKAALFIFLNKTCFNGLFRVNRNGKFNVPMGAYKNPAICDGTNLRNISQALRGVTIVCGDYSLAKQFIDSDTFVYLDRRTDPFRIRLLSRPTTRIFLTTTNR